MPETAQSLQDEKQSANIDCLKNKRILLCEDHPLNAKIAKQLLAKWGVYTEHAENGEIAVKMFGDSQIGYYDLILMDVRMPVMDGLEATKRIRAMNRKDAAVIPILAMTANAYEQDVRDCLAAGMDAHLAKPVDPLKMQEVLVKYLAKDIQ